MSVPGERQGPISNPADRTSYGAVTGSVLAHYRQRHGLDQADVAAGLTMSQATWSRLERGKAALTVEQLSEVAEFFNVSPGRLIADVDQVAGRLQREGVEVHHYREGRQEQSQNSNGGGLALLGTTVLVGIAAMALRSREGEEDPDE